MPKKKKKNPLISDRNPFDEAKALFLKEHGRIEIIRPFMVVKILSYTPLTFPLAVKVNERMNGMPKWLINMILNLGVPKRKTRPYISFPKRRKKVDVKLRQKISETYCTSHYHSDQIIALLRKKGEKPEEYYGLKEGE